MTLWFHKYKATFQSKYWNAVLVCTQGGWFTIAKKAKLIIFSVITPWQHQKYNILLKFCMLYELSVQFISTFIPKETEEKSKNPSLAPWLPKEFILLWQCGYDQHGSKISLIKATSAATDVISHNLTVMHYQCRKLNFLILMIEVFHSTKPSVLCLFFPAYTNMQQMHSLAINKNIEIILHPVGSFFSLSLSVYIKVKCRSHRPSRSH